MLPAAVTFESVAVATWSCDCSPARVVKVEGSSPAALILWPVARRKLPRVIWALAKARLSSSRRSIPVSADPMRAMRASLFVQPRGEDAADADPNSFRIRGLFGGH